ncbi:LysR family transcriptional regulator [Williamsia deligens]|uniref:LysR family transcriptional regulator n=1 Tax=Williamsia deligens TaxID=321325 RepID=A0ABW3G557_9NOCA|nr:LysR family transcriptional regulator [Williamsia deligens]MCP2193445.1 DNA-binding transcriptional regulator, LysR family [Williamsia deligens]
MHHLRYFLAVARELNFTRAARSLNMSVPPLSQRIRTLERELGTPLFERSTHHTRLTAAGEALVPLASSVVADFDAIPQLVGRDAVRREVRIAVPDVLNPRHRRALGDAIRDLETDWAVALRQMPSLDMESALASSSIDVAVSHVGTTHPTLSSRVLYREPLGAVVDASRFPDRTSLTSEDLRGMRYIQGPRHWDLGSGRTDRLAAVGAVIDTDAQFTDVSGMLIFLRGAAAFTVVPLESEVAASLDRTEFAVLPVDDMSETLTTYLVRRAADTWLDPVAAVLGTADARPD